MFSFPLSKQGKNIYSLDIYLHSYPRCPKKCPGPRIHLSSDQNPCDIPLNWSVNSDPYNGLVQSLNNWVVKPLLEPNQPGF